MSDLGPFCLGWLTKVERNRSAKINSHGLLGSRNRASVNLLGKHIFFTLLFEPNGDKGVF
jgi:hypothetical protein